MVKVEKDSILEEFIRKYELNNLFSENMKSYMTLYMFSKNDYICKEDEHLENMFFLVGGKAKVAKHLENGKSLLLSFYMPFTIIGDVEFIRNEKTDCSVRAIEDTYCIGIKFNIVRSKLINDCKFLLYICDYMAEKLKENSNNSSINLLYPLENRLASFIAASVDIKNSDCNTFKFKESQTEIAELLGTSYRHLNRTLSKFCSSGILEKKSKEYLIKDLKKLQYLAGDLYK